MGLNIHGCKAMPSIQEVYFLPFNPTDKRTALILPFNLTDKRTALILTMEGEQVLFSECFTLFIRLDNGMCCLESA